MAPSGHGCYDVAVHEAEQRGSLARSRRRRWAPLVLAIATVGVAPGCTSDPGDASSATSGASSGPGETTTTSISESSSSGAASTTEVGDGLLQCLETCEVPSECCLPGTPCPGPYPYNVDCRDGYCIPAFCVDDQECAALGTGMLCRPVRGVPTCVLPCSDDATCAAAGSHLLCRGTTDLGEQHCFEHCDQTGVFCGNQTCEPSSGLCLCESDGQCLSNWECRD
jgi:hypothetical protein